MKNILVVNVNWMGDVIFSSPIFKALKEAYPDAHVSCMAPPRVKEVLDSIPAIDEIIVYDEKGKHWNPFAKLKLILDLKKKRFDIAFLLHGSLTRALMVHWAKIPRRVGYNTKNRKKYLTDVVAQPKGVVHRSDYYLNVVESIGVKVSNRNSELLVPVGGEIQDRIDLLNLDPKRLKVVVHVGGNWDLKRWPAERFTQLISRLQKQHNAQVILPGSKSELNLVNEIIGGLEEKPIVLTGQTTLKELMGIVKSADLIISGDSGPFHLANSLGVKAIGLFGPTRPEITGPRGKGQAIILQKDVGCNRRACYFLQCPDNICMQALSVEEVLSAVRQIKD